MKNQSPKSTNLLYGIICNTFGHNYIVTRKVTNHINEYKCSHCNKEVTDNLSGKLEILTIKTREINSTLSSFFEKRSRIISTQSA